MTKRNGVATDGRGHDNGTQGDGDVRTLRPARTREQWPPIPQRNAADLRQVCILDVETTGLDWSRHRVIEVCAARVQVDRRGRIVGVRSIGEGVQDPGHALPHEIVELTGLTDAMLENKEIAVEELARCISSCSAVVAFNAAFDRPFIEAMLPDLPRLEWGCAMKDISWRQLGFEPGPQNYLLMQTGYYPPSAHRARQDVLSLVQLLAHTCEDGKPVMAKLLSAIAAPAWRFEATLAPYETRHVLKDRGYRYRKQGQGALWHKLVRYSDYQTELAWYRETIGMEPGIADLPASERYRHEHSWAPIEPEGGWPRYLR